MNKVLPAELKVTPIAVYKDKQELFTVYTSNRKEAAKAMADIIAAVLEVNTQQK